MPVVDDYIQSNVYLWLCFTADFQSILIYAAAALKYHTTNLEKGNLLD